VNLLETIEKKYTKAQVTKLVNYVGDNPTRFKVLVEVFFAGPYRITQRSAWPLNKCVELHPELVKPHLKRMLLYLRKREIPIAVKRNILRLLQFIATPKSLQGLTADICFDFLQDRKEPVAVRVFAMTVLTNLVKRVPELKNELIPLIEDQMPYGSPGFRSRGRRALKEMGSSH
jgi:hypothetical protein